jgi:hypothetical protein
LRSKLTAVLPLQENVEWDGRAAAGESGNTGV